ncbi:MAG: ATP synthase F0 subunit B [Pseudomonadota bacterium]
MEREVWGLIWRATNFTILAVLLYKLLAPRAKTYFRNRTSGIEGALKEAAELKETAEQKYGELKEKLENIDREIQEIIGSFRKDGLAEKERIVKNAKKEAEKIREQAIRTIEQEIARAKMMIRKEYAELVTTLAEDLLREKLNDDDQERLIKEYMEKVVETN